MNRTTKISAVTAAALMTAGIAGACSSSSSSGPVTGTETFAGTEVLTPPQIANQNFSPTVPITASGLFSDHGSLFLGGGNGAGPSTIKLGAGDINVHHAATNSNQQPVPVNPGGSASSANDSTAPKSEQGSACLYGTTEKVAYTVTGGTGSYKNVTSGKGTATVTFTFALPKMANGSCNTSNSAVPTSGSVSFSGVGPITRSS